MRILILICLLCSTRIVYGSGPKYGHTDRLVQDEFENVYKDIGNLLNGDVRISSVTISSLTVSSLNGSGAGGETVSAVYSGISLVSGEYADGTSISITTGTWLVTHACHFIANTTTAGACECGISTTAGNSSSGLTVGDNWFYQRISTVTNANASVPNYEMTVSGVEVTVYAKTAITWTGNAPLASGRLSAVRIR